MIKSEECNKCTRIQGISSMRGPSLFKLSNNIKGGILDLHKDRLIKSSLGLIQVARQIPKIMILAVSA